MSIETADLNTSELKKRKNGNNEDIGILNDFQYNKLLNESSLKKLAFVHGIKHVNDEKKEDAIIILEKPHFTENEIKAILEENYSSETTFTNDIYKKLSVYPTKPYNNIQVQLIYPATEKHIQKYTFQELFFINETYENYLNLTRKVIEKEALSLQWVFNILEHKAESERIVYEDPDPENGFILLPDMKWDGQIENFYCLALVHRRDLRSIRDLNENHLKLLEHLNETCLSVIKEKYNINSNKLKIYFHYQPSFYHLHVHFTHIRYENADVGAGRAHFLKNVIQNIKLCSDYYQKVELSFMIKKNDSFYKLYEPYI